MAAAAWPPVSDAATSATFDVLPSGSSGQTIDSLDITSVKPVPAGKPKMETPLPRGNPLWSVPLSTLSVTRERPIFSASRRPPPRAVVAPHVEQPIAAVIPAKAAEPERSTLVLIGSVVGDNDAVAVFLDRASQGIVRMRPGDVHAGWVLSSVVQREVILKKADYTEVLALQKSAASPGAAENEGDAVKPTRTNGLDVSYAPFLPRSTPKNGEPDGL